MNTIVPAPARVKPVPVVGVVAVVMTNWRELGRVTIGLGEDVAATLNVLGWIT
jgi:hypothetical protein